MIIDAISDLHGEFPELKGGDLLLLGGDYTRTGKLKEWMHFFAWLKCQPYTHKVMIAGNHDEFLLKNEDDAFISKDFIYLRDNEVTIEGLRIWGSPHSSWFPQVNLKCTTFMMEDRDLECFFNEIPEDIDILLTHTPPYGYLDKNIYGKKCGSKALASQYPRIKPKIHVFGHIHEEGGGESKIEDTRLYNISFVDENYEPTKSITPIHF